MNRIVSAASCLAGLAVAGAAGAAASTGSLAVSVAVVSNCVLQSAVMDFGNYNPGTQRTAQGDIDIRCTNGLPYSIGLGAGLAPGATESNRSMRNGAVLMSYNLYRNPPRTQNWGQTLAADRVSDVGAGINTTNNHRIYGRIPNTPGNAVVTPGFYTDTVVVTITY